MPQQLDKKILSWVKDPEPGVIEQVKKVTTLPFVHSHVALMPDAHVGMGSTIGSVIATKGAVIPSAVGVDLGCGMVAARSNLTSKDLPDNLDKLHAMISRAVPAGVGKGHNNASWDSVKLFKDDRVSLGDKALKKAVNQLGSLGSGNHFVEIDLDEEDHVWIVLHSGSRGIGKDLAEEHIGNAKKLMKKYFIEIEDDDLAYLVRGTSEYDQYIAAMLWSQDYAMLNRQTMLHLIQKEFASFFSKEKSGWWQLVHSIKWEEEINCHHNFCEIESHQGQNLLVTRKGAIRARIGDLGVIPGSMGTSTYIVEGLGNPASYNSCSHGAGRRMSRTQARKTLDEAGLDKAMEGKTWNKDSKGLLDEDPRAYKDIDEVMKQQEDLVTTKHKLNQILNYKGT